MSNQMISLYLQACVSADAGEFEADEFPPILYSEQADIYICLEDEGQETGLPL